MTDVDGPVEAERVTDVESFRRGLTDLLVAADEAGVEAGTMVGLLTANLAALRGEVRLPLSIPPERAHEFLAVARDREGETMAVDLELTGDVADDIELQLSAIRSGEGVEEAGGDGDTE